MRIGKLPVSHMIHFNPEEYHLGLALTLLEFDPIEVFKGECEIYYYVGRSPYFADQPELHIPARDCPEYDIKFYMVPTKDKDPLDCEVAKIELLTIDGDLLHEIRNPG